MDLVFILLAVILLYKASEVRKSRKDDNKTE